MPPPLKSRRAAKAAKDSKTIDPERALWDKEYRSDVKESLRRGDALNMDKPKPSKQPSAGKLGNRRAKGPKH